MATETKSPTPNIVLGKVTDNQNRAIANLIVHVFDRDMRSEELLAETVTDKDGKYQITWLHSQLSGRGVKEADISIKLFTPEKKTLVYESDINSIRFNASPREEINIIVQNEISPEVVEYDYLHREVTFLANKVAIADLQENAENQDITFLSKELEVESVKIEHLVVAHRLQNISQISPAFFYALLRKNTLLKSNSSTSMNANLSIGISTDVQTLLYDAALTDPNVIQTDVTNAAKEMIVASRVREECKLNIEMLREYRGQAEEYYKNEHPKKVLNTVTNFVLQGKVQEAGQLFQDNKDDLNTFFDKIADPAFFSNTTNATDAKTNLALGKLFGFSSEIIPPIIKSKNITMPQDLKKLAGLNKADWVAELTKAKGGGALNQEDKNMIDLYASTIVRKLEKAYPTAAFTAQLAREKKPVLKNHDAIVSFLTNHEGFDLAKHNIDNFIKENKVPVKESAAIKEELKSVQRVFKLVPQYNTTRALLNENIHSAQSIVSVGATRFVNEIAPKTGIEPTQAKAIFKKAEHINTAAMLIVGELQDTMRAMDIASLETSLMAKKLEAVSQDFPNLKSLFKLTDACACEHCRSVYSPAAYLVEILQFLDKRSVTDITVLPPITTNLAKDILFERRPDLGDIDLSCANAETPLKYIDLVCELLEDAIAPDSGIDFTGDLSDGANKFLGTVSAGLLSTLTAAGLPVTNKAQVFETEVASGSPDAFPHYLRDQKVVCKIVNTGVNTYKVFRLRQTLSSAEELAAAPEYVNEAAYAELVSQSFAFKLPFDLNHVEAKAYFNRFDLSRAELMQNFQVAGVPSDEAIAAEMIGLTDTERSLIGTPKPTLVDQQLVWNAPAQWDTPPVVGDVLDYMKRVDHFLDKTALSYQELDFLLTLTFIDPDNNLFIKNQDLSCDTGLKEIANLTVDSLDRIHRFLRLQKKTGWKPEVIDAIISQTKLGNGLLNDNLIKIAANLQKLSEDTGIKIDELIGCYGEIPHLILKVDAPKPLYYQVFLNKAKNGFIDEGLLPEKVDGSQLINTFITSISVCLQLKQQDLEKLLPLLPDGKLTFSNLSYLFAASRVLKKLKLKTDDYLILADLTGLNVSESPQKTLDFISANDDFKNSPLKVSDVKFMLRHEAAILPNVEGKIIQMLGKLQKDYQDNFSLNKSRFDDTLSAQEQKETLQNQLAGLKDVGEDDVKTFIKFIDRDWVSAAAAKTFTDNKLGDLFDTTAIKAAIDLLDAAPGPDFSVPEKNLVKAFLNSISVFELETGKQSILETNLSTSFKADLELVKVVLKYAELKQPLPGSGLLFVILESDALIDTDITHIVPVWPAITKIAFGNQFAALKLVYKLLPLINAFSLGNDQVEWFFKNNHDLGWFEWDSIPYDGGQTAIAYNTFINFAGIVQFEKQLTPVIDPSDPENPISLFTLAAMLIPGSPATRNQFIGMLALLTGYDKDDVDAIDATLFPAFDFNNYLDAKNWVRLISCAENLRKLGSDITQVTQYIKPVLLPGDVSLLRTALKSRYDEDTWLDTLKEIMDAIRPQKRDALVAYVLAINPDMKDENDLFDYFLVDVEMESCMPSSRIVQAHGTVQLFVQRCLMGLEPKATADLDNDTNWNQWKWMKNYRVWEANRKVFLYPENWLAPDLRDDKSFLFTEFENELQQNELTDQTAEDALIRYLEKLDNIAFLEVMATWYQTDVKIMHVFARTKGGDPSIYYYRRFEQERYWTPWEKVELDITGDQLLAFVRNNRLCLAWPMYSEEPNPVQTSTIPPATAGAVVNNDKPKRKLKIQLAISEFDNKKWQPKKLSKDGILTPNAYTSNELPHDIYNLMYVEFTQQVWFFTANNAGYKAYNSYNDINGIFNIAGCKGYPELVFQGDRLFPDFLPDFKNTVLKSQRYFEQLSYSSDDLAVSNAHSLFGFYEILLKTPGFFRLSYPLQFTIIDLIVLLFEYAVMLIYRNGLADRRPGFKIPLGTMLPYFEEDSVHAYVIIPGFYKREQLDAAVNLGNTFTDAEKRTASDVFQLIDEISNFIGKVIEEANTIPKPDTNTLIYNVIVDPDFQKIITELSFYEGFDFIYDLFIGNTGNAELDKVLTDLRDAQGLEYGEQFKNMYHPLVCALRTTLYKSGIPELMKRETQLQKTSFDFNAYYNPNPVIVPETFIKNEDGTTTLSYPIEDLDFASDGSYSGYNWELFFHVPFLLATRLTTNQRFEDAMTWFHYMFNPTGALKGNTPQKYWVTKPFYLNQDADYISQRIDTLLYKIADPSTPERKELEFAIAQWRNDPFKPDVVARFRPVAYQKALVMKYIDNLTEWGDYLFRQDTMESIVQATQMYILADKLLGPKPRTIPPVVVPPYESYNQIENRLDAFGNALIELENIIPDLTALPEGGAELPPPPFTLSMLYFCIPQNDQMLEYWDRIADRLFKIRNCQNIDGVERSLALFAPPIDPALLVRAAASGLDISSVLAGLNAPTPYYRFNVLSQKATELAQEVRGLGNSLLQALEKKDAEAMSLLRSELEIKVLNAVKDMKSLQIQEANEQIEILNRTKLVTQERQSYYSGIQKIIPKEQLNLDKLGEANDYQKASQIIRTIAGALSLIPEFHIGASGFGGSPSVVLQLGGSAISKATNIGADILNILSSVASFEANRASITASQERRFDDWKLQERLANKELDSIDKQISAAEIRKEIAVTDLSNHELQIDNAKKTDEFMRSKFTNKELYDWMIGQVSSVYFSAYQLSHDFAKKAERSYRFELGNDDAFISYGYWDSMKKGLQSADHLIHDIKRMETSYLDKNKREYEITKHVSLASLDPLAIVRLRATGVSDFDIPEVLYDMDHPGQYFRRIKSVSISLPCIAGPYTSVSAKLSLVNNRYRKNTNPDNAALTGYPEDPGNDERFIYNVGAIQSIAASNAQNDSGMFELNFRDERYLPFEGTGAVSSWRLELPTEIRQFDYNTIADVIIHVKYTAREGGSGLKTLAVTTLKDRLAVIKQQLSQDGLHIAINLKHDLPNEWNLLKKNGTADLKIDKSRLPYMAQTLAAAIDNVMIVVKAKSNPATCTVNIDGVGNNLSRVDEWKLCKGINNTIAIDTMFTLSALPALINDLDEIMLVVKFSF
jgi:hypothetical protein